MDLNPGSIDEVYFPTSPDDQKLVEPNELKVDDGPQSKRRKRVGLEEVSESPSKHLEIKPPTDIQDTLLLQRQQQHVQAQAQPYSPASLMMMPPPTLAASSNFGSGFGQQNLGYLQQQLLALQTQTPLIGGLNTRGRSDTAEHSNSTYSIGDSSMSMAGGPTTNQFMEANQMLSQQSAESLQTQFFQATSQMQPNLLSPNFAGLQPPFFPAPSGLMSVPNVLQAGGNTLFNPPLMGAGPGRIASQSSLMMSPPIPAYPAGLPGNLEPNAFPQGDDKLTGRGPVTLFMPCDAESLSEYQCLVRLQVEIFEAGQAEVESNAKGRNKPIVLGQVGIRCRHCSSLPPKQRARGAMYYPAKLDGLYQAAQSMASGHLCSHCKNIPGSIRQELLVLRERKSSAGGGKKYWGDGVRVLGVYEDDDGLRFNKK